MATFVISPIDPALTLSGNSGQIDLNYLISDLDNTFNDAQITLAGIEIYFSDEIQIDANAIIPAPGVGTIPAIGGRLSFPDGGNADGDADTTNSILLSFSPLTVSETETPFISIPFTTTAAFDGSTQINFVGQSANPCPSRSNPLCHFNRRFRRSRGYSCLVYLCSRPTCRL